MLLNPFKIQLDELDIGVATLVIFNLVLDIKLPKEVSHMALCVRLRKTALEYLANPSFYFPDARSIPEKLRCTSRSVLRLARSSCSRCCPATTHKTLWQKFFDSPILTWKVFMPKAFPGSKSTLRISKVRNTYLSILSSFPSKIQNYRILSSTLFDEISPVYYTSKVVPGEIKNVFQPKIITKLRCVLYWYEHYTK